MVSFGDFSSLCHTVPSYPWCNLFYRQLINNNLTAPLTGLSSPANIAAAPVGINPECGIPRMHHDGSLGNIANIIVSAVCFLFTVLLLGRCRRRKAAVGRIELAILLALYALFLPFNLLTTGAIFEQGSKALAVLTAVHAGIVAAVFWALLGNAIVATQVVEDGTISSLLPFYFFTAAFFAATTYIALDVGLTITHTFGPSSPPQALHSTPLFVLTTVWPGAAALLYFIFMTYIVMGVLREGRPMAFYALAAVLFVLSQLDWFLLSKVICRGSNSKVDGSFIATLLETASVYILFLAWKSITEETWEDDGYYN